MPLTHSHKASPLCSPAPSSHPTFRGVEVSSSKSPTILTQPKLYPCVIQCSVQKPRGLRVGRQRITRRFTDFGQSALQRCESQVSAWRLNVVGEKDDHEDVKLKIPVGPIRNCLDETFTFKKTLGPSSVFVVVTLRKPLGIIFEAVQRRNKERVVVAELVQGSHAQRAARVNQMFQGTDKNRKTRGGSVILNGDVRPGDILRATTTVGVVVDLFGIRAPQRVMMLHIADGRCWDDTMAALKASFVADGPLTLVLEREL